MAATGLALAVALAANAGCAGQSAAGAPSGRTSTVTAAPSTTPGPDRATPGEIRSGPDRTTPGEIRPGPVIVDPPPKPPTRPPVISYPQAGKGTWSIAAGRSRIAGKAGQLLRYRVAVERGINNVNVAQFADATYSILADPRGWTGGRSWRFQRVGPGDPYDFTLYLATPVTRDQLCGGGRDRYTSCRNGDRVVINVARWAHGVPKYGAPLEVYRQYVVNHEVGHRLGHGHETCPARGRPAPLMQQQTLGLHGCRANPWRIVGGRAYSGPPGVYNDPVPRA